MEVIPVPVLSDNFAYLLVDTAKKEAAAVDPAESDKVIAAARARSLRITAILTTHHHADHAGGNEALLRDIPNIPVYGGDDRIAALSNKVKEGDSFKIGDITVKVHFTPCHTTGHVLYVASVPDQPSVLFSGDTLFIGGCGRFFEGSADQMYHALCEVVASLPDTTLVYCGHEYTVANLQFAQTIEPDNAALKAKLQWAMESREGGKHTIPSTVAEEKSYNPFMRVAQHSVKAAVATESEASSEVDALHVHEVMRRLRQRKDGWKPK